MEVKVCSQCECCWEGSDESEGSSREPCPECGATGRIVSVHVQDGLKLMETWAGKVKDPHLPSKKKVRVEWFDGYEWSVALEKYVTKTRLIDKRQDRYHERVTDPDTGQVIHECAESLKSHQGHGYAKTKKDEGES